MVVLFARPGGVALNVLGLPAQFRTQKIPSDRSRSVFSASPALPRKRKSGMTSLICIPCVNLTTTDAMDRAGCSLVPEAGAACTAASRSTCKVYKQGDKPRVRSPWQFAQTSAANDCFSSRVRILADAALFLVGEPESPVNSHEGEFSETDPLLVRHLCRQWSYYEHRQHIIANTKSSWE